jgi:hypothetical protein
MMPEHIEAALQILETTATELHIAVTDGVKLLFEQTRALRALIEADHDDQDARNS